MKKNIFFMLISLTPCLRGNSPIVGVQVAPVPTSSTIINKRPGVENAGKQEVSTESRKTTSSASAPTTNTQAVVSSEAAGEYTKGVVPPVTRKIGVKSRKAKKLFEAGSKVFGPNEKKIKFQFDATELVDIINYVASERDVNITFPAGVNIIKNKVTLRFDKPVTVEYAWKLIITLLDLAGYTLVERDSFRFSIVKNSSNTSRESLPILINTPINELPNSDQRICYLYYLANVKVPSTGTESSNEVYVILRDFLSDTATIKFDLGRNAVIIFDKASTIKAAMPILLELDNPDLKEECEKIKLRFTAADAVTQLFNEALLKNQGRYRFDAKGTNFDATYFSKNVRIIPELRTNSIFVLGREDAIKRVKEFILRYIDVELVTGASILHTFQLLYQDSGYIADLMNKIIESKGGTEQSRATVMTTGPERFFEGVIVKSDKPAAVSAEASGLSGNAGSNTLIIACPSEAWPHIRKFIEEIDRPQPQIILKIAIADMTLTDTKSLGTLLRNPAKIPWPTGVNAQSAQAGPLVANSATTTLAGDLMAKAFNTDGTPGTTTSVASFFPAGTTVMTFADPGDPELVWGILQYLSLHGNTKILSHPHYICSNNQKTRVRIGESRLLPDEAVGSEGGATTAKMKLVNAFLEINTTARVASDTDVVVMVSITIDQFNSTTTNTRTQRSAVTQMTLKSGSVAIFGGLIRASDTESSNRVPFLYKIPIVGPLLSQSSKSDIKTSLTLFLHPTIVPLRLRHGMSEYTSDSIALSKEFISGGKLFDRMKDPVTHLFFGSDTLGPSIDKFVGENIKSEEMPLAFQDEFAKQRATRPNKRAQRSLNELFPQKENKTPPTKLTNNRDTSTLKALLDDMENPFQRKSILP